MVLLLGIVVLLLDELAVLRGFCGCLAVPPEGLDGIFGMKLVVFWTGCVLLANVSTLCLASIA